MYQALLTRRYMFSKVMPLLSVLAVALCVAMVLVVWSVMGGFLNMLLAQGRGLIGDVSIHIPQADGGLPHYEELIDRLEADPLVDRATPTIESLAIIAYPSTALKGTSRQIVQVIGIQPDGYDAVTGFFDRLWWQPIEEPLPTDEAREDPRLDHPRMPELLEHGLRMAEPDPETGEPRPAVIPGVMLSGANKRTREGFIIPYRPFLPEQEVTLSVLPISEGGVPLKVEASRFPVANEFRSGLYEADANWVFIPLAELQKMLLMDEAQRVRSEGLGRIVTDEQGNEVWVEQPVVGIEPARVTNILIAAAEGVTDDELEVRVEQIYRGFAEDHPEEVPASARDDIGWVYTWEKKPNLEAFIAAVKNETVLVLVLFSFISLTAVFLIFSIFWSMVSEKTKDIGVLRAIGASRKGVAWLYLRYGLAIGITGSLIGGALAYAIIWNINPIHDWMGAALGIEIWNPETYYFTEIPSDVETAKAVGVVLAGILFSVVGALVPALRAAWMDPVKALRFE